MADAPPPAQQFDRLCLDVLQWLAKTLGQMSLYKVGHPAVAATLRLAEQHLTGALANTAGELTFSMDQGKWIANGCIIGATAQTPHSVVGLFNRFKLSSITFKSGCSNQELIAFCELAAMRADAPQAADPKAFLAGQGVANILLNEAVYTKLGKDAAAPAESAEPGAVPAAGGGAGAGASEGGLPEGLSLDGQTLEGAIQSLVTCAVPEQAKRAQVTDRVMQLVGEDIQRRVMEVTKTLRQEKTVLQNEQARTQNVIGNMVEGVVVVDEQGKILMMNPAAEQVYGVTLAQAAGKHLTEKAGDEHLITLATELTAPNDREIVPDVQVKALEDTRRTLKSAGAVVQNEAGKVVGMVSSLSDVAKHKELQRVQRDFVAHVTHELRAPLSSIRAALEILEGQFQGKLKEDEGKLLNTALKNSDRLADMINSILDFSKIESGQMTVYPKQSNPEALAQEAHDSIKPWAMKKGINLELSVNPSLPTVNADPKRTVQIL
ncbi:MAG: histidine kinase dimerization/phospho-acceptor domain-containing protein, partial [Elusimicrobiota bacterium]